MVKSDQIIKKAKLKDISAGKAHPKADFAFVWPVLIVIAGFLIFWFIPDNQAQDPWYEASSYLDSAQKTSDPATQKKYLEMSGSLLRELIRKHPYHARVRFFMGLYYYKSKLYDSANIEFREAIKLDSGGVLNAIAPSATKFLISSVCNVSANQLKDNKIPEAMSSLNEIMRFQNISPELNFQIGLIYQKSGRGDSSIRYYEKTLRINPQYVAARNNLGLIYLSLGNRELKNGNYDNALSYFSKAITIGVRRADMINNLGLIYFKKGDFKSAITYFRQALSIDQNYLNALRNLIQAYRSSGDNASADALISKFGNLLKNNKVQ
jgi:tetratricopeptide (TPR) repeat protein